MKIESITELLYIRAKLQDAYNTLIVGHSTLSKVDCCEETNENLEKVVDEVYSQLLDVNKAIYYRLKIEKITDK